MVEEEDFVLPALIDVVSLSFFNFLVGSLFQNEKTMERAFSSDRDKGHPGDVPCGCSTCEFFFNFNFCIFH